MKSFNFWQKWLFVFGIYLSVFGVALSLFTHTTLFDIIFNNHIDHVFWGDAVIQANVDFRNWAYGVLGPTISGWGIAIAFIAHYPFKEKQKWAWKSILTGALVWFIVDQIASIKYGVTFNVFFNSLMFIFLVLPLVFTYKQFKDK